MRDYWQPLHACLATLVRRTRARFGCCLLVDCHSMPRAESSRADFVLGDAHGTSCAETVMDGLETALSALSYRVGRNDPYAGGYITRHYGTPCKGVHAVQIEVARHLYMDERLIRKTAGFARLRDDVSVLVGEIAARAEGWLEGKGEGAALDPLGPKGPRPPSI